MSMLFATIWEPQITAFLNIEQQFDKHIMPQMKTVNKVFKIQKRAEQQLHLTKTQADQEHLHTKPKQQQSLENYHIGNNYV
ncbi:hypothetical protein FF38_04198 [Lucilia cuprina]|uniref:Uncharacterized protein n=1 Tax=Lucilia cuprina TaxID=7375 RepID=A0A0L0BWX7_LUCCU|nr:hypothetical protein FF38_04198 [Lucilia cuprina]